jgi:hypothetical protein
MKRSRVRVRVLKEEASISHIQSNPTTTGSTSPPPCTRTTHSSARFLEKISGFERERKRDWRPGGGRAREKGKVGKNKLRGKKSRVRKN